MLTFRLPPNIEATIQREVAMQTEAIRQEKDLEIEKLKKKMEKKAKKHRGEKKKLREEIHNLTVALCFEKYGEIEAPDQNEEHEKEEGEVDDRHEVQKRGESKKRGREGENGYKKKEKRRRN